MKCRNKQLPDGTWGIQVSISKAEAVFPSTGDWVEVTHADGITTDLRLLGEMVTKGMQFSTNIRLFKPKAIKAIVGRPPHVQTPWVNKSSLTDSQWNTLRDVIKHCNAQMEDGTQFDSVEAIDSTRDEDRKPDGTPRIRLTFWSLDPTQDEQQQTLKNMLVKDVMHMFDDYGLI